MSGSITANVIGLGEGTNSVGIVRLETETYGGDK